MDKHESSYDILQSLFERIGRDLKPLNGHSEIQPTHAMTEILINILADLLIALAFTTKEIKLHLEGFPFR